MCFFLFLTSLLSPSFFRCPKKKKETHSLSQNLSQKNKQKTKSQGQTGKAKLVHFDPVRVEDVALPSGAAFVIANSLAVSKKAETADARYNLRVVECRLAAAALGVALGLEPGEAVKRTTLKQVEPLAAEKFGGPKGSVADAGVAAAEELLQPKKKEGGEGGDSAVGLTSAEAAEAIGGLAPEEICAASAAQLRALKVAPTVGGLKLRDRAVHVFSEAARVRAFAAACSESVSGGGDGDDSEEAGGRGEGAGGDDREWREALLSDEGGEEEEGSSSFLPRSRAGGGLRVPRALFWGLEFLRYACETRWSGGEGAFEAAATAEASGADDGGQHGGEGTASTFSSSLSPPPPPPPRAFLGEAGHDVTLDFERALRREVPDGAKARVRYFRRFYLSRRRQQQQQQQEQQERQQERQQEQQPRARGNGGGGGGSSSGDEGEARIRLWGCYRPSRLDRGGGDEAARRAQEELFDLAFSSSGAASGAASGDRVGGGGEEEDDKTCLSLPPPPPPPPPFSREALALELADLGWGLFTGGEDRAERLRASRRRRERAKRDG